MSGAAAKGAEPTKPGGPFAFARKLDGFVFEVEKAIVAFSLVTITVVVFVDVVARRIDAPDSKIGRMIADLGGVEDDATRAWIDASVAPWATLGIGLLLLGFGMYSARRFLRMRAGTVAEVDPRRELGYAVGFALAGALAGWGVAHLFQTLDSWVVYAGAFGLSALAFSGYHFARKKDGWVGRVGAGLAGGAALVWLSVAYVPEGYTWSKKVALLLLLWVGLLSASICVHAGKHIRMGAAQKLLPEKARRYVNGVGFLATAVFCALMTFLGFMYVVAPMASTDEYMTEIFTLGGTRYVYGFEGMIGRGGLLEGTEIPDWLGIIAAPVGFGIATIRFLGAATSSFLGGTYGEDAAEEGMEEAKKLAEAEGPEAAAAAAPAASAERSGERAAAPREEEE